MVKFLLNIFDSAPDFGGIDQMKVFWIKIQKFYLKKAAVILECGGNSQLSSMPRKTHCSSQRNVLYIATDTDIHINRNRWIMSTNWVSFTTSWLLAELSAHTCVLG